MNDEGTIKMKSYNTEDIMKNSINNVNSIVAYDSRMKSVIGYIMITDEYDDFSDKYIWFNDSEDIKKLHDVLEELIYLAGRKGL